MSHILDALKRAEEAVQSGRAQRSPREPPPSASGAGEPVWDVKMVSPNRFVRIRVKAGCLTRRRATATKLALLLLYAGTIAISVWVWLR